MKNYLWPIIETNRVDEIFRNLTTLFNKKTKEESEKYGKKPKSNTSTLQAGKAIDSTASKVKLDVYDDDEYYSDKIKNLCNKVYK